MKERRAADATATEGLESWMTEDTVDLARAIAALRDEDEALRFLRDLCTIRELVEFGHRWTVARLLDQGVPYHEISERTGASSATISRVNQWLRYGRGGYQLLLERLGEASGAGSTGAAGGAGAGASRAAGAAATAQANAKRRP